MQISGGAIIVVSITIRLPFFLPNIPVFLYSLDAAPSAPGAPGAPMSVKAYDINSDYVLVAWKPPNTVNEAPITGYFVDRSVLIFRRLPALFK